MFEVGQRVEFIRPNTHGGLRYGNVGDRATVRGNSRNGLQLHIDRLDTNVWASEDDVVGVEQVVVPVPKPKKTMYTLLISGRGNTNVNNMSMMVYQTKDQAEQSMRTYAGMGYLILAAKKIEIEFDWDVNLGENIAVPQPEEPEDEDDEDLRNEIIDELDEEEDDGFYDDPEDLRHPDRNWNRDEEFL